MAHRPKAAVALELEMALTTKIIYSLYIKSKSRRILIIEQRKSINIISQFIIINMS